LKYKDSHEPVTNYAEDHILNTVNFNLSQLCTAQSHPKAVVDEERMLFLL
jgi:hypothetical protein